MKRIIFVFFFLSIIAAASAIDCKPGYEWNPKTDCIQRDCNDIPDAHYSYTGSCVCGSSGSIEENPNDPNIECRRSLENKDCPGCVYACVHRDENCPDDTEPHIALPESYETGDDDRVAETEAHQTTPEEQAELERLSELYIVKPNPKTGPKEYIYDVDELDEHACSPAERVVYEQHKTTKEIFTYCSCRPGFKRGEQGCIFDTPDIPLSEADMNRLEKTLLNLQPGESTVYNTVYELKRPVSIGIVRRNDYELTYTIDGKTWNKDLKALLNPSIWQSTKKTWNNAWSLINPVNWFGHTAYKDADKELTWQIADATLKRYRQDMSTPKHYMYDVEYWYTWAQDKNTAARTLRDSGLIDGTLDISKGAVWGDLKGHLYAFPAESVKKLQSELTSDDFAQAFSIYIQEREHKTPQEIAQNPSDELDLAISIGTASTLGQSLLYQKYEEAYQRYLVAQQFKDTNKNKAAT